MSIHTGPGVFVGFDGIPFTVLAADGATYPDWEWRPVTAVRHIFGSNTAVVQHMGSEPATITLRLDFDSVADFRSFRQKQGVTSTLVLMHGMTSAVGPIPTGYSTHALNGDYEYLDQTMLLSVGPATIAVGQAYVEVSATFLRCMDPLTGLAVTS